MKFTLTPSSFRLIGDDTIYQGYTYGIKVENFACPWFTKEVADRIAKDRLLNYDAEHDAYEFPGIEDYQIFQGTDLKVNGKTLHLYPIGAAYWVWEDLQEK